MEDQGNQGESKGYIENSALQETTKAYGDRVAVLLRMNLFPIKSGISKNGAHKSWYLKLSWMPSYIAEPRLGCIVRCILTQTSQIQWNQGQTGQSIWDQQETCRGATSFCCLQLGRK